MTNTDREPDAINWKNLYDVLTRNYESKKQELAEANRRIQKIEELTSKQLKREVFLELYEVYDKLELLYVNSAREKVDQSIQDAISMIMRHIDNCLSGTGIQRITVDPGTPFDPALHNAIESVHSEQYSSNCVLHQIRCGYRDQNSVIRPADVSVIKDKSL